MLLYIVWNSVVRGVALTGSRRDTHTDRQQPLGHTNYVVDTLKVSPLSYPACVGIAKGITWDLNQNLGSGNNHYHTTKTSVTQRPFCTLLTVPLRITRKIAAHLQFFP